jgi:O-6-methylguanine DNA methyltransferase
VDLRGNEILYQNHDDGPLVIPIMQERIMIKYIIFKTPLGNMIAAESNGRLCLLEFVDGKSAKQQLKTVEKHFDMQAVESETATLKKTRQQLDSYFAGKLKKFNLPLTFAGTDFQKSIWHKLDAIPYGDTSNYGQIAEKAGKPGGARAAGQAIGSNPISIIVPCHRVIGKNGDLTGYGGKMWRKKWLLKHEGVLE